MMITVEHMWLRGVTGGGEATRLTPWRNDASQPKTCAQRAECRTSRLTGDPLSRWRWYLKQLFGFFGHRCLSFW